ncbi:MAG TPA: AfsR/SARP family transcriptional regulator [Gaiellaceae bacterium]|nr:AfsR/SARP family transcriptional regulator [Gaiellaceae bacterium]
MEFRLLGDLEIADGERLLSVGGKQQRALLALLLLRANHVVAVDTLIEDLWGENASSRAAGNLHSLVSRLRGTIGGDRLERHGNGYLLRAADAELDVGRFEQLREAAAHATGEEASAKLRAALELWRGPALADFTYEAWAQNDIRRLEELRLVALEERIEAELSCGRHAALVGELQALVAEHPLRETFRRQLIVALYRSGRQAEALDAYRDARRVLDEELGLEPSPQLRELEQAVLRHDSSLEPPRTVAASAERPKFMRRRINRKARLALAVCGAVLAFVATAGATLLLRDDDDKAAEAAPTAVIGKTSTTAALSSRRAPRLRPDLRPRREQNKAKQKPAPRATRPAPPATPPPAAQRPRPTTAPPPETVVPTPQRKPSPKKRTPAPKPAPVRLTDNFEDGVIARNLWHDAVTGAGVTVAEQNGRLEVAIAADAKPGGPFNLIAGQYGTGCRFLGDFDVSVDFELLDWPPANGVLVQLAAWAQRGIVAVGRQSQAPQPGETYWASTPRGTTAVPAGGMRGGLRIRRVGPVTTSYQRVGTRWSVLLPYTGSTGAPMIGLQAMALDETFGDRPVRVAFDNFVMTAAQPVC